MVRFLTNIRPMHSLKLWLQAHYDYAAGGSSGLVSGFITYQQAQSVAGVILISVLTGAAGAFGAHLVKLLIQQLTKHKKNVKIS